MSRHLLMAFCGVLLVCPLASAQEPETRAGVIVEQQQEKAKDLKPYEPDKGERLVKQIEQLLNGGVNKWHPFFDSAYRGGGFTLGAGYLQHVGDYNWVDVRGSFTPAGYVRFESEYRAPRLFDRRGDLTVIGGWRRATRVGFYGFGTAETSKDDQAFYGFTQPYLSATLQVRPTRRWLLLTGGAEYSHWRPGAPNSGLAIDEVFPPSIPGFGAEPIYLQLIGGVAVDSRASAGYARRGGYYGASWHDFQDRDDLFGFRRVDYEALQHIPIGRDAWVLSLRGRVETTYTSGGEEVPYFMMPALGGGSDLRGFVSWRFRDLHSMLLQAEWRVLINAFFETALFYDAGKVTHSRSDLDFKGLKSDYGIGMRVHGLVSTPLRIDFARSNEGLQIVFAASAVF